MKQFIKLIPAALALVALASCSSDDDLLGGKSLEDLSGKTVLKVNVEQNGMRAYASGQDAVTVFGTGDVIRVYDDKLQKYDSFKFYTDDEDDSYFVVEDEENRNVAKGDAKFALFGAEGAISYAGWNNGKNVALVKIESPAANYDEGATNDGVVTYKSALPLWGPVTKVDGQKYEFEAPLARLTGYAAVTFTNGKYGKVTNVRARSLKYAAGKTKADYKPKKGYVIDESGANVVVKDAEGADVTDNEGTFVTAEGAQAMSGWFDAVLETNGILTKTDAPVEATADANIVEVAVDVDAMKDYTNIVYLPIVPGKYDLLSFEYSTDGGTKWTVLGAATDFTATRTTKVTFGQGFAAKLDQVVPEELSEILAGDATISSDLTYDIEKLLINANDYHARYEVRLPAMAAENVTLNVSSLENKVAELGTQSIVFMNDNDDKPFTGKLTINVTAIADDNTNTKGCPITINLPNAENVVLAGNYTTAGNNANNKITVEAAKNLAIGDGTTTTIIGENVLKIATDDKKSTIAESFTIAEKASVGQNITLGQDVKKAFTVNVGGDLSGSILSVYRATTSVTGKGRVKTLRTMGDVTIEGTTTNAFTVGNLYLNGTGHNVALKSGIVTKIDTQNDTEDRTATITNEETGASYIGSIEESDKIEITLGTSKWAGKKLTGTYVDKTNIYTASMLASINGSSATTYKLLNNIDLNGSAEGCDWAPVTLKKPFDGNKKTISNLKSTKGGLFNVVISDAAEVKDLTISSPTIALAAASETGVGVLANTVETSKLTVTNVKATGITITGKDATSKVGGLIGANSSEVDLKGVSAAGSIAGYSSLGGLIGYAGATVTIQKNGSDKSTSTVTISANYDSGEDYDLNYAAVGKFIGSIKSDATVTMTDVTVGNSAFTHDTSIFKGKVKFPVVEGVKVTGKDVVFGQDLIGYSGNTSITGSVSLSGKKYKNYETKAAGTAEGLNGTDSKELSLYYIDK